MAVCTYECLQTAAIHERAESRSSSRNDTVDFDTFLKKLLSMPSRNVRQYSRFHCSPLEPAQEQRKMWQLVLRAKDGVSVKMRLVADEAGPGRP